MPSGAAPAGGALARGPPRLRRHARGGLVTRRRSSLHESAFNLCEFVDMFLFTLTDSDARHQQHARKMTEAWLEETRAALDRRRLAERRRRRREGRSEEHTAELQ